MILRRFRCIKKLLTDEFLDVYSDKLKNKLNIVDDLCILFITQDFQSVEGLTNLLPDSIFLLVDEKWKTIDNISSEPFGFVP